MPQPSDAARPDEAFDRSNDHGEFGAQLRAAFEQSPVSTVIYDSVGRPVALNRSFERLWGATMADVPPDYTVLTDPQLGAAGILPLIERAFAGEPVSTPPVRYEMPAATGTGRTLWTQAHLFPVRDASGAIAQVVLTHEDVTARMEAEAQLRAALERADRLQAMTSAVAAAVTPGEVVNAIVEHGAPIFGADGIIVVRYTADRESLAIMSAADMPAGIADQWQTFPADAPVPLAEVARTGEPVFLESREQWEARYPALMRELDATGHHANAIAPLVVRGGVLGALGIAFRQPHHFPDAERTLVVTVANQAAQALERARLFEAEQRAREDAEAANRAKSDFLTAMSHELRTPLNAIAGHVELLEMGLQGPVTPEQREALQRIQAAQRYLLRHVNDVLNFARVSTGRLEYRLEPVRIAELVRELHPMVAPQMAQKQLEFSVHIEPNEVTVADREKLGQALLNLLSNATKFTPTGGSISVTCARRRNGTDDPQRVYVRVADTGIGIPRDKCDAIFEPFVQVDVSLAARSAGSGLGLAISRDLVRGMGGELRVRSEPGVGTAFTMELPRAVSSGQEEAADA